MTLKDVIDKRGSKYDEEIRNQTPMSEYWVGYRMGWHWAYQDLKEILDQWGVDAESIIFPDEPKPRTNLTCERQVIWKLED
jgi:hypothetical protein